MKTSMNKIFKVDNTSSVYHIQGLGEGMKRIAFSLFLVMLCSQLSLFSADILTVVKSGTVVEVQQAINSGADVNVIDENGWTPLMISAYYNPNPMVLSELINAGAEVDARVDGASPLMFAAANNMNVEVLLVLIDAGADVNARITWDGRSPLMIAAFENQNPEVLSVLINAGADLNSRTENGKTPLMLATENNPNVKIISVLINAGADVNARDRDGMTSLMLAARYLPELDTAIISAKAEVLSNLIKANADGSVKDGSGRTAFDYAKDNFAIKGTKVYWELNDARYK
jgi:ankyrin repeat protein